MKPLFCLFALLSLVACVSREEVAAQKAAEDDALCASMGIYPSNPNYFSCRWQAAGYRMQEQQSRDAALMATAGAGLSIMNSQPAAPAPRYMTTCQTLGTTTNCW